MSEERGASAQAEDDALDLIEPAEPTEGLPDMYDVTVRVPIHFDSGAMAAGFIERAVSLRMRELNYAGSAFVIWRGRDGRLWCFLDGAGGAPYPSEGVPPHGLGHGKLLDAALGLLWLKDGPRDDAYRELKPQAWENLRDAVKEATSGEQ